MLHRRKTSALMVAMVLLASSTVCLAKDPATQPTSVFAETGLVRTRTDAPRKTADQKVTPAPGGGDATRILLSLGAVLALIFGLRFVGKRYFTNTTGSRSSHAVRVLTRTVIGPRQNVILLQVGKRIIVVGDCGAQMSALSQITDPDEAASLLGQIQSEKSESVSASFSPLLGRAGKLFDGNKQPVVDEQPEAPASMAVGLNSVELADLMGRVRSMSQRFKNT